MMIGLRCISVQQLDYLKKVIIPQYEHWCDVRTCHSVSVLHFMTAQVVAEEYDVNFAFFKQHAVAHVVDDIQTKGALQNQSTRPSEGFQQEVKQQYNRTDKRAVERQVRTLLVLSLKLISSADDPHRF